MFYVANAIIFSVFLKLPWKFTLIVRHKLNIFWPLHVNHFDIRALLFGGYARFIPLDKMVFCGYWKSLPSVNLLMSHIALTLFLLCNGLCCSLLNYYLNNSNSILPYAYFYYFLSGWNYIIHLTPNYRKFFVRLPRIYSIYGLYSSSISLHRNTRSVLNVLYFYDWYIF